MPSAPPEPDHEVEQISNPGELLRIATMTQAMLDEVRTTSLDEAGRERLTAVHEHAVEMVQNAVSPDLRAELAEIAWPLSGDHATESELRLAQAQLIGWLNGIFLGIRAAGYSQLRGEELQELQESLAPEAQAHPTSASAYL
jgi:hypothetical protein